MKLYRSGEPKRSAFREAAALALAEALDLPVPRVLGVQQVGDRWGVIMSRAEGPCFVDAMRGLPERLPSYLAAMAQLQFRVHSHPGTRLGGMKVRLAGDISRATMLGEVRRNVCWSSLPRCRRGAALPRRFPPAEHTGADWAGSFGRLAGRYSGRSGGRRLSFVCADEALAPEVAAGLR